MKTGMNKKETLKEIEALYDKSFKLAIDLIESEARRILKKHNLNEFIMCMGSAYFTIKDPKNGNGVYYGIIDNGRFKFLKEFETMIDKLNDTYKICGYPMRFTATGEVINNW